VVKEKKCCECYIAVSEYITGTMARTSKKGQELGVVGRYIPLKSHYRDEVCVMDRAHERIRLYSRKAIQICEYADTTTPRDRQLTVVL
jgi:hypothetical protein